MWRLLQPFPSRPLPLLTNKYASSVASPRKIRKVLAANRGEIAVRIARAATEMGLKTASIYSYEDRLAPHRYKSDESYLIGEGLRPVEAYLSIPEIVRVSVENEVKIAIKNKMAHLIEI
jgi:pyruvate carboxylase